MNRIHCLLLLLLPFVSSPLVAQNGWDFDYLYVLHLQHGSDTTLLRGLKVTVLGVKPNRYSDQFWINPPKTNRARWHSERRTYSDYCFPFAGDNYVSVFNVGQGKRPGDLAVRVQIEDTDGLKNGGFFPTRIVQLDARRFYHLSRCADDVVYNNGQPGECGQPVFAPEVIQLFALGERPPTSTSVHYSGMAFPVAFYRNLEPILLSRTIGAETTLRFVSVEPDLRRVTEAIGIETATRSDSAQWLFRQALVCAPATPDTTLARDMATYLSHAVNEPFGRPDVLRLVIHTAGLQQPVPQEVWLSATEGTRFAVNLCEQRGIRSGANSEVLVYFVPLQPLLKELEGMYGPDRRQWRYQLSFLSPISGQPIRLNIRFGEAMQLTPIGLPAQPQEVLLSKQNYFARVLLPGANRQPEPWIISAVPAPNGVPDPFVQPPAPLQPIAAFHFGGRISPGYNPSMPLKGRLDMATPNGLVRFAMTDQYNGFSEGTGRAIKQTNDSLVLLFTQTLVLVSHHPELDWEIGQRMREPGAPPQERPLFRANNDTLYLLFDARTVQLPDTFTVRMADGVFTQHTAANWTLVRNADDTNRCEIRMCLHGQRPGVFAELNGGNGSVFFLDFRSPLSGTLIHYFVRSGEEVELGMYSEGEWPSRLGVNAGVVQGRVVLPLLYHGRTQQRWEVELR